MLQRNDAAPLYAQLADQLRAQMNARALPPGARLPAEKELAARYGISLITVRQALALLAREGRIERKQGKGTYVQASKYIRDFTTIESFTQACAASGHVAGARLLARRRLRPVESVARALRLPAQEGYVYIERLRTVDGQPVAVECSTFPPAFDFLMDEELSGSLFAVLRERAGVEVTGSRKVIDIVRADREQGALLQVERNAPLLRVQSVAADAAGCPVYVGTQIIHGERFALHV